MCWVALVISSCQLGETRGGDKPVFTDTINYTYKTVKQKAADCNSKTDNGCNIVKFTYPVFNAQPALNDSVFARLASMFSLMGKNDTSFTNAATLFFAGYRGQSSNDPQQPAFCPLNEYAKVVRQDSALTSIETGGYLIRSNMQLSSISFINWNPRTHQKQTLDEIFKPGYQDSLKIIAERIFRSDEKLSDSTSFAKGYLFKDGKFALNNNYLIAPMGLRFLYNEGEIKPRNKGFTILFIPYAKIKPLLKPHTVVTQYMK